MFACLYPFDMVFDATRRHDWCQQLVDKIDRLSMDRVTDRQNGVSGHVPVDRTDVVTLPSTCDGRFVDEGVLRESNCFE